MLKYIDILERKVNEGKFLLDINHSFLRASGNTGGMEKFTHDAGRVNCNAKIKLFDTIINIKRLFRT